MKHLPSYLFLLLFALLTSCANNYKGFDKMENGAFMKFHVLNEDGQMPQIGDVVLVKIMQCIGDSVIFHSDYEPDGLVDFDVTEPIFIGDMMAGVLNMHLDDSATIVFPIDSLCIKTLEMNEIPDYLTHGEPVYIDLKIVGIITAAELEDNRKQELYRLRQNDEDRLSIYYSDVNNVITNDGLIILGVKGKGRGPKYGEILRSSFSLVTLEGDTIFYFDDNNPVDIICGDDYLGVGFDEAMRNVPEGGEGSFVIPSSLAFDSIGFSDFVKPYSSFILKVKNVDIMSVTEYEQEEKMKKAAKREADLRRKKEEPELIDRFLKEHNITVEPSATGVYFLEIEKGTGPVVKVGDVVSIHYNLYNLDDKLIETSFGNEPLQFIAGANDMVPGIEEAVWKMNVGGKATIILPSKMAFDSIAISDDIPAYSPVVFDILLVDSQHLQ